MKNAILLLGLLVFSLPTITDAQERITLADESVLSVFMVRPSETTSSPAPLLVLMGGGPGNASISRDTSMWLGSGFAERGWIVAVPVSPNNRAFRGSENNAKVEQLIVELQKRDHVERESSTCRYFQRGHVSAGNCAP